MHKCDCLHEEVKYCLECDKVYCESCGKEWVNYAAACECDCC
jgi:hypothetical protein